MCTKCLADQCLSDPCKNGGTCALDDEEFATCTCVSGLTGDHCEDVIGSRYCSIENQEKSEKTYRNPLLDRRVIELLLNFER